MLSSKGKPIVNYEDFKHLYNILKLKSKMKKHYIDMARWKLLSISLQQKVTLYAKRFHWILREFTGCNEQGLVKK